MGKRCCMVAFLIASTALPGGAARAQMPTVAKSELQELRDQIVAMRVEQARTDGALRDANARIAALEARPSAAMPAAVPQTVTAGVPSPAGFISGMQASNAPRRVAPTTLAATDATPSRDPLRGLDFSGDLRLRYEGNFGDRGAVDRSRGVIRGRLRASYALADWLSVGGQLVTGDPDDPESSDVSLGNFDDDLQFALDQAYIQAKVGDLTVVGGKFANPFERTELVWDGDVFPQGVGVSYRVPLGQDAAIRASGLIFLVDERADGPDSTMVGGQLAITTKVGEALRLGFAGGYYDYRLKSLAGADAGDFRSNLLAPDGLAYLSDFNLVDAVASLTYTGLGERWPVQLVGDYVRNVGAATDADTGYSGAITIGRAVRRNDWRLGYTYMSADTDAVLAAFSHDNLALATNYEMHGLSADFVAFTSVVLNATVYHYRVKDPSGPGGGIPGDWRQRLRLNLLVTF